MKTVNVDLGERAYPIYIGNGILADTKLIQQHLKATQLLIVSDANVAPLYMDILVPDVKRDIIILPDGEKTKSLDSLNRVVTRLIEKRFHRDSMLIALGGGVIGDLTGFVAACYQRGIRFIQIPTTLLAQVDSSVGGKTAVNHPLGKNMIGAFHQPSAVFADIHVLSTLPDRQLSAGLAEIIKYGLIRDCMFFDWLEDHIVALMQKDSDSLISAIERSCINKAEIIAADERESGVRAILNLGHTFGHAIETALSYQSWLHGEAVACGMLMAADLSSRLGMLDFVSVDRIRLLLKKARLPIKIHPDVTLDKMLANMKVDKKAKEGRVYLVLLDAIGKAKLTADYAEQELIDTITNYLS